MQKGNKPAGWARYDTWRAGMERSPKNDRSWFTAVAFCHAEGGRLPTEAKWRYVAAGGDEVRPYPWGDAPPSPERAAFHGSGEGSPSCSLADLVPVGFRPAGAGRRGDADLVASRQKSPRLASRRSPVGLKLPPSTNAIPSAQREGGAAPLAGDAGPAEPAQKERNAFVIKAWFMASVSGRKTQWFR